MYVSVKRKFSQQGFLSKSLEKPYFVLQKMHISTFEIVVVDTAIVAAAVIIYSGFFKIFR